MGSYHPFICKTIDLTNADSPFKETLPENNSGKNVMI
jgi:hypothetical protein